MPGQTVDYLPEQQLLEVRNLGEFAGILALDKWTCNINGRQAVFQKSRRERRYRATFIDQGYCFHAGDWKFIDASLGGVFAENTVYRGVTGWESFEPWLSRIENLAPETAWAIAEIIPPEWYGGDLSALEALLERLLARRARVRELIVAFGESARRPFPNWGEGGEKIARRGCQGRRWMQDSERTWSAERLHGAPTARRMRATLDGLLLERREAWWSGSSASFNSSVMCRIR